MTEEEFNNEKNVLTNNVNNITKYAIKLIEQHIFDKEITGTELTLLMSSYVDSICTTLMINLYGIYEKTLKMNQHPQISINEKLHMMMCSLNKSLLENFIDEFSYLKSLNEKFNISNDITLNNTH